VVETLNTAPELVAVLDMGASAIRLVVAETAGSKPPRVVEEASRGVLLGRDVFSSGAIHTQTVDSVLAALEGLQHIMSGYHVTNIRAVATSAVREARNAEMILDRIRGRTGITFDIINEAEESRLVFLAARQALRKHAAFKGAWTLLVEVGGGSTSLTLLRRGQPNRSALYALGAVRMRQQLDLRAHRHELQIGLLRRHIANVVEEIRVDIPLDRVTHMVAVGGDVRFAAGQILEKEKEGDGGVRDIPRDAFLAFCDDVAQLDDEGLVDRFRLPAVETETLMPALLVYRVLLAEIAARHVTVADASLRQGVLLDMSLPGGRLGGEDFERQVLASAEALGQKYRFDRAHGRHVAMLSARLFDQLRDEHRLGDRERLLLRVAALVHDIGVFVSLRAHHRHTQYLLAASQVFGLTELETAMVSNIARYHRRGFPSESHLPYIALDRQDRVIVNKLAAILRVANALDAEHLQTVKDVRVVRQEKVWMLELDGTGELAMEQKAATARADMLSETFGTRVLIRPAGVIS
jgi:exopolyphosphatase/guanosine-5'-triphosphate,3'-diphosphate pyrophosphatase